VPSSLRSLRHSPSRPLGPTLELEWFLPSDQPGDYHRDSLVRDHGGKSSWNARFTAGQLSCRFSRPNHRVDEALTTDASDIIVTRIRYIVVCDATINKNAEKQHERRENRRGHDDDGRDSSAKNDQEGSETREKGHDSNTYT
jgi:hypothetical protein